MARRADTEQTPESFNLTLLSEQVNELEEEEEEEEESAVHVKEPDVIPDVTLRVEGEYFYVNRQQLALQSPYFRALFFGCGVESTKRNVEIKGVSLHYFRILMEYSRTSNLALDRENVLGILETADFLQLERARLLCCKFLERELHLSNCLGMMAYAWQLGCIQLYKAARQVALSHFSAIVAEEDFLSLSKESIADLLASDDLAIHRDDLALEATLRWVSFDQKREEHFLELTELVRPESLSLSFITDLLIRMKSSDPRAKLICMLNEHFPTSWSMGKSMRRTRASETLFVLGGPHDQEQQALYQFHPLSGRWQCCVPLQRKNLTQYSVAAVGDNVVVTGGYFRDVLWFSVDWVRIFECGNKRWVDGPALLKSRHSHCSIGLDSVLYVLGGSMDEGLVADVERLVLGSEEGWEGVSPMIRAVERAATAALGSCFYVACGLDENGEAYGGIQKYTTMEDQWDVVSYSPFPRYDLVATELNGALYLFGGQALRFDVETDEWTELEEEECLDRKFFSGCATVNSQIYLVSERKSNKAFPNMVMLDPYIDTCIEVDDAIPCPVPLRGCVTMRMVT
ncbi:Kelch-like protein 25 Ectoderm-neural cortex protein 2 [Larimichthys crocea]|uniref:Kelch-like protein 25 Ectoderm-neural cortex protein 2 n=1 Tax=Larimichthys crocea TaxID=215358 RepID=A0A6G0ISC1_LARCR|nr:Kelch-like protein 25 Ectoderm-neural cortex protein 2 [Larimichthys crocea]